MAPEIIGHVLVMQILKHLNQDDQRMCSHMCIHNFEVGAIKYYSVWDLLVSFQWLNFIWNIFQDSSSSNRDLVHYVIIIR
jgi:hypothetical protein